MQLNPSQAHQLLGKRGVYATEACDKCGRLLGAVRFTRRGEAGEWCSRECRGDAARVMVHRGGRPRKHFSNSARQKAYRSRILSVTKPVSSLLQTSHLQA
jgi:hypothetical protein